MFKMVQFTDPSISLLFFLLHVNKIIVSVVPMSAG